MKQIYKSVSFPRAFNRNSGTKVLKLAFSEKENEIADLIIKLNSSQIRTLLNNRPIEEIEEKAVYENRSLNNISILLIKENLAKYGIQTKNQLDLFLANPSAQIQIEAQSVTFKNNKKRGIFNWYPYIEGFSYDFVEQILNYVVSKPRFIYDPFAGTGTTILVASERNIRSGFSEINPLMRFIVETKINALINFKSIIKQNLGNVYRLLENLKNYQSANVVFSKKYERMVKQGFFREDILAKLVYIKEHIIHSDLNELIKKVLLLVFSTIIVKESNMIRRADLRYKRNREFNDIYDNVIGLFISKCNSILSNLEYYQNFKYTRTKLVSEDAKKFNEKYENAFPLPTLNLSNFSRKNIIISCFKSSSVSTSV